MYNIAEMIKLNALNMSANSLAIGEKRTFEPINTAAIRYPKKWLLKFLILDFP